MDAANPHWKIACEARIAYMDVGKARGCYRHPALLRHKHIHVQKQDAVALP